MKKTGTLPTCSLCIFLAMLLVFYCFPVGAVSFSGAAVEESADGTAQLDPLSMGGAFEVTELREENVKHFRLPDGSFVAAQYDTAVHYKDALGAWADIDNTLSLRDGSYVAENGISVAFPKRTGQGVPLLTLSDGEHRFSFSLEESVRRVSATVENPEPTRAAGSSYAALSRLTALSSSIRYTDIVAGVDLEYVLHGDRIYENIILKDASADASYTFRLSMEGLALTPMEGELLLTDKESGESVFTVPASFMTEAATTRARGTDSVSTAVSYAVAYDGEDVLLTISADKDWLGASGRAYPVTVDPPVFTGGNEASEDTYVSSDAPSSVNGDSPVLIVGRYETGNGGTGESRALWRATTFPTLPVGSAIVSARLALDEYAYFADPDATGTPTVTASLLTASFTENETNYANAPASGIVLDYTTRPDETDGVRIWQWDISKAYIDWTSGGDNYGVCLSMYGNGKSYVHFVSSEASVEYGYVPTLAVAYRSTLGIDPLYGYTTISTPAGTAYLSDAEGSITLITPTVSASSALWDYTPTLIYRSQKGESFYLAEYEDGETVSSVVGGGFMMDFEECVSVVAVRNEEGVTERTYVVHTDADGTENYFEREGDTHILRKEGDAKVWFDEHTSTLHYDADGSSTQFGLGGKLLRRTDASGNALCFT